MWKLLAIVTLATLAACHTPPAIFGPEDTAQPTGSVEPLTQLLPQDVKRVRMVFVHGVGDHCPGFAFGRGAQEVLNQAAPKPWLDENAERNVGLQPRHDIPTRSGKVNASTFMETGGQDDRSYVYYRVRYYDWPINRMDSGIELQAIEITWSPLTQWVKTNLLGYDAPSVIADKTAMHDACMLPPDPNVVPKTIQPMSRVLLNQLLKESVLDRELADAIIYVGSYGKVITRGVADALCHAITGADENQKCAWPESIVKDEETTRHIFVTHSLGSRIVYDMFLDLIATNDNSLKPNPFSIGERRQAQAFMSSMLGRTPAIYMMANQLPMLGLANVSYKDSSSSVGPFALPTVPRSGSGDKQPIDGINTENQVLVLEALGRLRSQQRPGVAPLQITAFHDTNDLLTWHLPRWYSTDTTSENHPTVKFTNVFVQNATRWFGVFENPSYAHTNYFSSGDVWRIIHCGGKGNTVSQCPE